MERQGTAAAFECDLIKGSAMQYNDEQRARCSLQGESTSTAVAQYASTYTSRGKLCTMHAECASALGVVVAFVESRPDFRSTFTAHPRSCCRVLYRFWAELGVVEVGLLPNSGSLGLHLFKVYGLSPFRLGSVGYSRYSVYRLIRLELV